MTGPKDVFPPEGPTDVDAIELPIRTGQAAHAVLSALANLTVAIIALEKVAMACARALDATAKGATP